MAPTILKKEELPLLVDLYELTMAQGYFEHRQNLRATFDLFIRRMPQNRSFFVCCGLEDVIDYLANFKFNENSIEFLRTKKIFSDNFLSYLKSLRFTGDLWAMPEGTVFFAQEPILRITAPLIEAQIVESFLLNAVNLQTMIASKAARVALAAKNRKIFDFSLRRTHGIDAAIKAARASYIGGCAGTSNTLAGEIYGIPIAGTMAHSFVMAFDTELSSFRAFADTFPNNSILLVDTYDTKKGIENATYVAKELEARGCRLKGIRLDSGNLTGLSKMARKMLDKERLNYVKIFASGNLDEYRIEKILSQNLPIDSFGVGTNMGTSNDAPFCDVIYKISQIVDDKGRFLPTMKLSKGKVTYPGNKQVYRVSNKKRMYSMDIVGLDNERIEGEPLLRKFMAGGKSLIASDSLDSIKRRTLVNLSKLPAGFKSLKTNRTFPVKISNGLKNLTKELMNELKKRSRK